MTGNRTVHLVRHPDGLPRAGDFTVVERPVPTPGPGEVLVRNRWFRVSASTRMMIGGGLRRVDGVPFPGIEPGRPITDLAVGEVLAGGPGHPGTGPAVGSLVGHVQGWREHAVVPVADCEPVDPGLPDPALHLTHAWTAYAALRWGAGVRAGDTVFVTGATGSIGSCAAGLARRMGATRVIGSTSSPEKAARLVAEAGCDAGLARHAGPIATQLAGAAADGIDVLIDTVGGDQLAAAVAAARPGARLVVVGALSGQLDPAGTGTAAPVLLDSFRMLLGRLTLRGFSADHVEAPDRAAGRAELDGWLRSGSPAVPLVRVTGLDAAVPALLDVIDGRHLGTVVVEL